MSSETNSIDANDAELSIPAPSPVAAQFGQRLRELRRLVQVTQEDLAGWMAAAGHPWSKWTVSRSESGLRHPDLGELLTLADLLGVPVTDLIGDQDHPRVPSAAELSLLEKLHQQQDRLTLQADRLYSQLIEQCQAIEDQSRSQAAFAAAQRARLTQLRLRNLPREDAPSASGLIPAPNPAGEQ